MSTPYTPEQNALLAADALLTGLTKAMFAKGPERAELVRLLGSYRDEIGELCERSGTEMDEDDHLMDEVFRLVLVHLYEKED